MEKRFLCESPVLNHFTFGKLESRELFFLLPNACLSLVLLCNALLTELLEPAKSAISCRVSSIQNTISNRNDLTVLAQPKPRIA